MKRFILLAMIIVYLAFTLTGCQLVVVKEEIEAVITDVQYEALSFLMLPTYNSITKTTEIRQQIVPAKYLVTITFEDVSETFNDKELYDSVKEGDTIQMVLYNWYDTNNNLIEQELRFAE